VSRYQKGKINLDFTEARDSEWQWHQLGHMQICTSLQTDNHTSTSLLSFFTGRMPFLPPNQQRQSTEGNSAAHQRLYNEARHVLPRLPFPLGGSGPPADKWFLGRTQVHYQTILIGSAVCAWLTVVQQTDRHTDHGIVAFVATGCIFALHACDAA